MPWARRYQFGPLTWGYALTAPLWAPPVVSFHVTLTLRTLAITLVISRELR